MAQPPGEFPTRRKRDDVAHDLLKAATSAVPYFGGLLAEVLDEKWRSSLERRRLEWFNSVSSGLEELAGQVVDLRSKLESEEFLSLFLEAYDSAQRTHDEDMWQRLKNAVLNAALDKEPEDWQHIFVGLLRELQPAHVQLLAYADDPEAFLNEVQRREVENQVMTNIFMFVNWVFPTWSKEFYQQLRRALESNGLAGFPEGNMTGRGAIAPRTTSVGKRFLAFIQDPLEE